MLSPTPVDQARLAATLLLELMQVTRFSYISTVDGRQVATFMFLELPLLRPDGSKYSASRDRS